MDILTQPDCDYQLNFQDRLHLRMKAVCKDILIHNQNVHYESKDFHVIALNCKLELMVRLKITGPSALSSNLMENYDRAQTQARLHFL